MKYARIAIAAACVLVLWLYWKNDDNAGVPDAPRGDGQYLPILDRGDGHMLFLMARSTALDFDWNFDNDLKDFGDPWRQPLNREGHKQIPHPVGPALVWTPLIWVAEAGAYVGNVFGADIPLHGYTNWHQRFVFLSSVLAACGAVLLGRRLAMQLLGATWSATYAAIAVLLGTSLTYYATNMPSYGHALDAGACAAFLAMWALTIGRTDLRRYIILGLLLGVAMLIRQQDAALGIVVAIEVMRDVIREPRRAHISIGRGALVLGIALVVFIPQLYYWHVVYGDWTSLPQGARYTRVGSPMILELLYAPRNGWFSTTPLAYLATLGLACLPKQARFVAIAFAVALFTQVYLCSTIIDWWGMASFGQRRLCSVTLILVVGLAGLMWRTGQLLARLRGYRHSLAIVILLPFIAWNLWRVSDYQHGKAAPADLEPTCCEKLPARFATPLRWIYNRIGNPFEFPANLIFALRHDVEIQRWDNAVGNYALMPPAHTLLDDSMYAERGGWRIGYPKAEPYLVGGWSDAQQQGDTWYRWTTARNAVVLVPNLMPYPQRMLLTLAPGYSQDVTIRWDGKRVMATRLERLGFTTLTFDIYDMPVGEHELQIEAAAIGAFTAPDDWPQPTKPVGVAVNRLEIEMLPP